MLKRIISAIIVMAFVFTQCGLSYALRPEQGRGGEQVAKAIGAPASATGTVQIPKAVDVKKHIMNMLRTYSDTAEGIETVTVQEIVNKLAESHAYNIAKIPDSEKLLSQRLGLRKGTRKQFWMERLTKVTKKCLDELVKARQIVPDGPNAYKVAKASLKITIGPGKGGTASATGEPMTQDEAFAAIKKFFEKRNRDRCENVLVFPDGTIDLKDYEGHIDDIRSMLVRDEFLVLEQPEHVEGGILYRELDIWPATQASATGFTKSLLETYDDIKARCNHGETVDGLELSTGGGLFTYALSSNPREWLMYDMLLRDSQTAPRPVPSDFCARLQLKNIVSIKFAGKVFDVDRDALISALDVMEGIAGSILNETEKAAASESSKTDITDKIYYRWANSRYSDLAFRVYKPDPQSPELVVEVTIYKSVAAKIAGPGNEEVKLRRLTTIDVPGSAKAGATGREIATAVRDALNHQHIEAVAVLENVRQAGDLDGIKEVVDGYREGVDLSAKAAKNVADADQANRLTREVLYTLEDEFEIAEAFYNGEFFNAPTADEAVKLVAGYVESVKERLAKAEEKVNIAAEAEKRNALISGLDADSTSRVKRMLVRIGFYDDEEHIKIIDGELTFEALEQARQLYSIVITQDNANDPLNMYMQDSEGVQQMSVAANIEDLKKQVEAWISV